MAFGSERTVLRTGQATEVFDAGLRAHMLRVYNYMASGLALTGIVAYAAAYSGLYAQLAATPLIWVVMLAPLGFIFFLSFKIQTMRASTAQTLFWAFAGIMGLSMAFIFLAFTGASIARVFFITAGTFAAMSLWGYTTKRDLTGMGSFLFMGLIGIILASIVNMFIASSALHFAISAIGVIIFVGLTAYDTQKIKNEYAEWHDSETSSKLAIMGALRLYLDFINLFMLLLHFFGDRR